jgi:predicted transcriptional regulator
MQSVKFSLRLDSDRYAILQNLAEREGYTVSMIVRHLVYRFLEQEQRLIGRSHD